MKLYGLIGYPLTHSFSKQYFTDKFLKESITGCAYVNFEIANIQNLSSLLLQHPNIFGLNVTIPHKQSVLQLLDKKDAVVEKINACNCIKIVSGKLLGFNTDVVGFKNSLLKQIGSNYSKALVLGNGGASKAVQYVLDEIGINYLLVSRKKTNETIGYNEVDKKLIEDYPIIINTTPLGMFPNIDASPELPYQYISSNNFLFDLIYNPVKTKFLEEGEKHGAQICNGYEMLVGQAEESWRIWNDDTIG